MSEGASPTTTGRKRGGTATGVSQPADQVQPQDPHIAPPAVTQDGLDPAQDPEPQPPPEPASSQPPDPEPEPIGIAASADPQATASKTLGQLMRFRRELRKGPRR